MSSNGLKAKTQKIGGFLSGMVMPNIGAMIAWGILTALFIPTGFLPNEALNTLVGPTLTYLIPLLFAYTGGHNMYGTRGGVAGALATIGIIIGSEQTMLAGALIMGPLGAWCIKKIDKAFEGKVKPGMEMLVDNFSMGIFGFVIMIIGFYGVGPLFGALVNIASVGVDFLVSNKLLPLTSIFIVPGQTLFLNNAINHGILTPLAIEQAAETGKSMLFLLEANCGNWAGLVLAYSVFGKGMAKKSAPGASIIMILGGIGEVCFPYCLMKPITMLGVIAGGITGIAWLQIFNGGAVAAVSPGSFLALVAMTPKGGYFANVGAYVSALIVTFLITAVILKADKSEEEEEVEAIEGEVKAGDEITGKRAIKKIAFACDAGMGSSAMGASMLKVQLNKAGVFADVDHVSVHRIPADVDLVITNGNLYDAAKQSVGADVPVLTMKEFLNKDEHKAIVDKIKEIAE